MKTIGTSVVGLTLALWSETLFAQSSTLPIYVSARLPPVCQGTVDFGQRLLARTERLRWANAGDHGVVFNVSAQEFPTGLVGQLEIRELSGRVTQRSVEGTTCDGVLDALAFVAAVLVEEPEQPVPPQPVPPQPAPPPAPQPPPIQWPDPSPRTRFEWGFGFTAGATTATSDSLVQPNVGVRASLGWEARRLDPWLMVGFDQRVQSTAHAAFAGATVDSVFGGWSLHASASPIRWPAQGGYFLRPVVTFEIGQLTAKASNANNVVANPSSTNLWLAAGIGASAELMLLAPIAAVADLGLEMPLNRRDYYYQVGDAQSHAFSVPYVGLNVRLGVILKFE
jgi:hypothetical protein